MEGKRVGDVTHFYNRISVAVIEFTDTVQVGDSLHFLGRSTDFRQVVTSLQIEHENIDQVVAGQEAALKVERRVRRGDKVFKLSEIE